MFFYYSFCWNSKKYYYICIIISKLRNMDVLLTKDYILGLIEKRGMTKAEFASRMGVKRQNLDALLDSKKKDINTIIQMTEILGISLEDFLNRRSSGVCVGGFIKINDTIREIKGKDDLLAAVEEIERLEKKDE